jgi:NADH-quinone oxidoreductase subunit N
MQDQAMSILPALPEIFLGCMAMLLLLYGVFRGDEGTRFLSWFAVLVLVATAAGVVILTPESGQHLVFSGLFIADSFAVFAKVLILAGSAVAIIMSISYNEREGIARFEFPILCLLATLGMMMMVSANNLISLYLGLELQSLALYVVAAFRRDSIKSTEAGLKYFVLGALSSGMLLYGASMVYGFTGTTGFTELAAHFQQVGTASIGVIVGIVFVVAGLAFKVAAFPFHMWTPDVYEGAPTPVTAFFAAAPKLAAMALFLRVMVGPFGDLSAAWQQIIWFLAVGSMILGSLAAINQRNIKRLLAYSSIGHVGFALVGLASGTSEGVRSVLIYMAIYIVMTIGAFGVVLSMQRHGRMVEEIGDLAGLSKTHPMMALAMAIYMFSMAGIPPLAGFFGKLYVFLAAIEAGMVGLAVIGVLSSVVASYYYLRIVKVMYFDDTVEVLDRGIGRDMAAVQAVTGALTALFFLYPTPLLSTADAAVKSLTGG